MITSKEAKQLCAKGEYELFALSRPRTIKILTTKDLKSRIRRSRKARDKYAKLTGEQERQARGKQAPKGKRPSKGSQRTSRKQQLFAQTLDRYESRLSELEQQEAAAPAKKKSASKRVKKTKKKAVKKKTTKATKKAKAVKKTATTGTKKKATARTKKATAKKVPKRKKKPVTVSSPATTPKNKKSKKKPSTKSGTALRQSAKLSGQMRKRKHLSAQSKRNQSRRDSR